MFLAIPGGRKSVKNGPEIILKTEYCITVPLRVLDVWGVYAGAHVGVCAAAVVFNGRRAGRLQT